MPWVTVGWQLEGMLLKAGYCLFIRLLDILLDFVLARSNRILYQ
jgi:hypothetical protein